MSGRGLFVFVGVDGGLRGELVDGYTHIHKHNYTHIHSSIHQEPSDVTRTDAEGDAAPERLVEVEGEDAGGDGHEREVKGACSWDYGIVC